MKSGPRSNLIPISLAAMVLGLPGCRDDQYEPPPPPAVTVALPVQREVTEYLEYTGNTEAFLKTDIYARVSGYLESVHFNGSEDVKKDQLLFTIDKDIYTAERDKAEAEWLSRQAELKLATDKFNAIKNAHDKDSATDLELWQAEANMELATAQLASAKADLQLAELNLSFTEVRAPFDGRMSEAYVDPGNLIGDGERTLMATLVQYTPMYVYFDVSERDVLMVMADTNRVSDKPEDERVPLTLILADEHELGETALADYAETTVKAGTLRVRAIVQNDTNRLYPGLFVRVRAPTRTESRLLVPQSALQRDLSGHFVMLLREKQVETEDGQKQTLQVAVKQNVKAGVRQGLLRVIEEGLSAEDQVIVVGIQRTRDGGPVSPEWGGIDEEGEVIRPGVSDPDGAPGDMKTEEPPAGAADEPKGE